jgi:hypothetical protein
MTAMNCCVPSELTFAPAGETETTTPSAGGSTVAITVAFAVVSATLVALIVTAVLAVTWGAWKTPALEMLPALANHVTRVLLAFVTVAENV